MGESQVATFDVVGVVNQVLNERNRHDSREPFHRFPHCLETIRINHHCSLRLGGIVVVVVVGVSLLAVSPSLVAP